MSDALVQPAKVTSLTTPSNSFVDVAYSPQDGYLLYQPDQNAFIALYPDEFLLCRKVAEENNKAIEELQAANQDVTEKSLALANLKRQPDAKVSDLKKAQEELDQALASLDVKSEAAKQRIEKVADLGADENKLVELLPLTLARDARQRTWYVPAKRLKSAMADKRVYLVEGKPERNKGTPDKLLQGTSLNTNEIKRRIANQVVDKAKFGKKWKLKPKDGDEFTGQFFSEWSKTMGASAKAFLEREQQEIVAGVLKGVSHDPTDSHRQIDLKADAQLMRWAAGAGLEANCLPFQGNIFDKRDKDWKSRFKRAAKAAQFNIKANAEASFALGEAKVETIGYYPHFAGWHLVPAGAGVAIDMGHYRFRGDMSLYAVAGASVALEASVALMLTADKQGLRGVPKDKKAVKTKASATGEVKIFAGLKEGIDLNGALQWLNPEGFIDDKSPKRKDPKKTWGEYADIASVSGGVAAIQGLAASLGLEVGYRNGNFVLAAKASGCLGLGGSGNVACKVGTDQIGQMFMCVAHQLKQADYSKLSELMDEKIFTAYNQVLYVVQVGDRKLRDFAESGYRDVAALNALYRMTVNKFQQGGEQLLRELEPQLRTGWGWFAYMPPEARGALIASIVDVATRPAATSRDIRHMAAFAVNELLATTQSQRHLDNTLDRVTVAIGDQVDRGASIASLSSVLADSKFAGALEQAEFQLAKASPVIQRPFMRNDESSFIVAQLPLQHPTALV